MDVPQTSCCRPLLLGAWAQVLWQCGRSCRHVEIPSAISFLDSRRCGNSGQNLVCYPILVTYSPPPPPSLQAVPSPPPLPSHSIHWHPLQLPINVGRESSSSRLPQPHSVRRDGDCTCFHWKQGRIGKSTKPTDTLYVGRHTLVCEGTFISALAYTYTRM